MRQALILLLGGVVAFVAGAPLLILFAGGISGILSILIDVLWPPPQRPFIDPVNRPRPITRKGNLTAAGSLALFGAVVLLVVFATPLGGDPVFRLLGLFLGGYLGGAALMIPLTERRTREAHNRWLAAMSPQPEPEWKS